VVDLERELKQVCETAVADKKSRTSWLRRGRRPRRPTRNSTPQALARLIFLQVFSSLLSCTAEDLTSECCLYIAYFHRQEDDLKNELKNTKDNVRSLEVNLREVEAGGQEMKQVMKETIDNEFDES
jgi:hypothetical protein